MAWGPHSPRWPHSCSVQRRCGPCSLLIPSLWVQCPAPAPASVPVVETWGPQRAGRGPWCDSPFLWLAGRGQQTPARGEFQNNPSPRGQVPLLLVLGACPCCGRGSLAMCPPSTCSAPSTGSLASHPCQSLSCPLSCWGSEGMPKHWDQPTLRAGFGHESGSEANRPAHPPLGQRESRRGGSCLFV